MFNKYYGSISCGGGIFFVLAMSFETLFSLLLFSLFSPLLRFSSFLLYHYSVQLLFCSVKICAVVLLVLFCNLFCTVLFYSVLFCSVLFYYLFCSSTILLFCSVLSSAAVIVLFLLFWPVVVLVLLFYSFPFCFVLFCAILFYSI